jgi:hypothetical protein
LAESHQDLGGEDYDVEAHVDAVNRFASDGLWQLGRYIAECLLPEGRQHRSSREKVLEEIAAHPRARHPYAFLKQCLIVFNIYPDLPVRLLPENFYFDLAVRVFDEQLREQYERQAIEEGWNITQLRKAIRDGLLVRREQERNELGFDLKVTNWWYFNSADPRFGKSQFRGRIAGQIVANALYYYARANDLVLDPFAGGGTVGDVIDKLACFDSLTYRLYDLRPCDSRILQNDILMGLPEASESVGYIFLDPPYGQIPRGFYTEQSQDLSRLSNEAFVASMRALVRECWRVAKPQARVSIVIEQYLTASSFYDLPNALSSEFCKVGFQQIGKVYLPNQTMRRGDMMPHIIQNAKARRFMLSDCRELLTYEKRVA